MADERDEGAEKPGAGAATSGSETREAPTTGGRRLSWELTPIAPEDLLLSVVIPVFNEEQTLEAIVDLVRNVEVPTELVLVDDGSSDGTPAILDRLEKLDGVRVFRHAKNRGKGAALKTGFREARGNVVIIQDADMEYDPREYPTILEPIVEGRADVVFGSRFLVRKYARVHLYSHYLGNRFLTFASNVMTGLNLTDMETCYKCFRKEVVDTIDLRSRRFDVEPELTAKVARGKWRIYEVPVSYAGRDVAEGKKISWKDGFAALWAIVKYRFKK